MNVDLISDTKEKRGWTLACENGVRRSAYDRETRTESGKENEERNRSSVLVATGSECMAGVWHFKGGVARNVPNPFNDAGHRKILVHCPSNEIMTSFEQLDEKLLSLGWHPYNNGQRDHEEPRRQYHLCGCSPDLLTLPATFNGMRTMHMYDIVVKTRSTFQVRDALKIE